MPSKPSADQPSNLPQPSAYVFGHFRIDITSHQLWHDGERVTVGWKLLDTLLLLVRNRDKVVRKEELLSSVWPDSFVSDDSLAQNISLLRRILGDSTGRPEFIATIPREGYRFIAPAFEEFASADVPSLKSEAEQPRKEEPRNEESPALVEFSVPLVDRKSVV